MTRFEYKFVKVEYTNWGVPTGDFRAVIIKHGSEGWRLAQIRSAGFAGVSYPVELIFERPVEAGTDKNSDAHGR